MFKSMKTPRCKPGFCFNVREPYCFVPLWFLAKSSCDEEVRSKQCSDPAKNQEISQKSSSSKLLGGSKKKRKAKVIASSSHDFNGSDSDKQDRNEILEHEGAQFILKGTPTVTPRMQCYTNINVMDDLALKLSKNQLKRFRETTCFFHLLNMERCHVQAQLFRCFMLLELEGSSKYEFIIHINGCTLRFTRRELALVSGLKCCDEGSDFVFNTNEPNRLIQEYFPGKIPITKQRFVDSFNNKVWGQNDDDAVKFAHLYYIHSFIMSEEPTTTTIDRKDFDLVESGRYVDYPWGNRAFKELTKNLHEHITLTGKYYRIHGFPLAMQIWLYECCSDVNQDIACRVHDHIPRILNWETKIDKPRYEFITKLMFKSPHKQIIFRNISPTATELSSLQLPPEYTTTETNPPRTPNVDDCQVGDSDDDFQARPKINKEKGKAVACPSPAAKKLRSSAHVALKKTQPKVVEKQPVKRPLQHASVPWHTIDNIFIPVNMKDKIHWLLIVISFNERSIMVYDSIRSKVHDDYILNEVKKYAQLIPMYKKRGLDVSVHPKYKLHTEHESFDIFQVNNIPQQPEDSLDCGVYMAAFAEYLSDGNGIPNIPFNPVLLRSRYATLLWDYGMRKIEDDAVSDSEAPEKPKRNRIDSGVAERILIQEGIKALNVLALE